jgi:hypothetical protein
MENLLVVVRDFRGLPTVARLWRDRGEYIDVVGADTTVGAEPVAIGFPRGDVFRFDKGLVESGDWTQGQHV